VPSLGRFIHFSMAQELAIRLLLFHGVSIMMIRSDMYDQSARVLVSTLSMSVQVPELQNHMVFSDGESVRWSNRYLLYARNAIESLVR